MMLMMVMVVVVVVVAMPMVMQTAERKEIHLLPSCHHCHH
jgi:hypothetical protein